MVERAFINEVTLLCCYGDQILPYLDAAARLRIEVFREYPYLYDGTLDYERDYLQSYSDCPDSIFVCAIAGESVVGLSTALPLAAADDCFQQPFRASNQVISDYYYLGESVLLPPYRGRGIGHAFFDHREEQARKLGYQSTTFCSVLRPENHPLRPLLYRSNEAFWRKRGYEPQELRTCFRWKEMGQQEESTQMLEFWSRELTVGTLPSL